ncbi:MAG: DUF4163 domain-containing protein, partial [Lachnospiraceae bacterium]|nr:DUF4163 domain-containing protein [Lachnospiraceae bacterium]
KEQKEEKVIENPQETKKNPVESQEPEPSAEEKTEDVPASQEPEPEKKKVENLTVLFSNEWLSKWNKEQTQYLLETTFNTPKLSSEDGENYPELGKALDQYARSERKRMKTLHAQTAKEAEKTGIGAAAWSIRNWLSVSRADSRVVSLMTKYSDYLGGAHGMYYTDGISFDAETGKILKLEDVFADVDSLPALLEKKLIKKYGKDAFYHSADDLSIFADYGTVGADGSVHIKEEDYTWCISNDGVTFYFAPYSIAPYAGGEFECLIPFRKKDLFQGSYAEIPKAYARALAWDYDNGTNCGLTFKADLDEDGMQDTLEIDADASDDYGSDYSVKISYSGNTWKKQLHGYSYTPVLMHLKGGRNYLYLGVVMENDYPETYIFSLSKKGVTEVGSKYLGFHGECDENERYYTSVPADPKGFKLDTRMDVLSTYTGWKKYHVGKNGMPVADSSYYKIESSITMTSLRSMKLSIVDKKGKKLKSAKIPKGETFVFYRTDGKKYVDMKLSDGRICRLHISPAKNDLYGQQVEGMSLEKTFSGFMFAG